MLFRSHYTPLAEPSTVCGYPILHRYPLARHHCQTAKTPGSSSATPGSRSAKEVLSPSASDLIKVDRLSMAPAPRRALPSGTAPHSPITRTLSSVPYFDLLCFLPFRFLCSPPFRHGKARPARGRPEENCRVYHRAPSLPPELDSNVILCKR